MGGLLRSVGDSIGGLFANTIGAFGEAIRGAIANAQATVPWPLLVLGVLVFLLGAAWVLAKR